MNEVDSRDSTVINAVNVELTIPSNSNHLKITYEDEQMSKYPRVILFRYDKYASIVDPFFKNKSMDCEVIIVNKKAELDKLFDVNYPVLLTYGPDPNEYTADVTSVIAPRMNKRWIHKRVLTDLNEFSQAVNTCYIDNVIDPRPATRPVFSAFTTCYNSYDKIERPLNSLLKQTLLDWEWVVLDDSPDDKHFNYLREKFRNHKKIRLFKRSENSGNIGNVKNEAASLCRGAYVLELDHDDEIVPELFEWAADAFVKNPEVGFVYGETINLYENGTTHFYGDFIAKGYGGYYHEKFNDKWVNVYVTPQINNITMSHLVSLPNHPRMWRRDVLHKIGNYSEFLPINDDQEILMRTFLETKTLKIPKICYIQYMNDGGSNFSLIRNHEINRIGPYFLVPQFYAKYNVHKVMKERGAYDAEHLIWYSERVWLRPSYTPAYDNLMYQPFYDTQYAIIGTDAFYANLEEIQKLYENPRNDFFFMENHGNKQDMLFLIDRYEFDRMKYYTIRGLSEEQMVHYFNYIYKTCEKAVIMREDPLTEIPT